MRDWAAGRVSTRELRDMVAGLPLEGTALWRKMLREPGAPAKAKRPSAEWWAHGDRRLLADIEYRLAVANWQRSGGKGRAPRHMADAPAPVRMGRTNLPPERAMAALDRIGVLPAEPDGQQEHA